MRPADCVIRHNPWRPTRGPRIANCGLRNAQGAFLPLMADFVAATQVFRIAALSKVGSCREEDVCRRVEGRFGRVLEDADDEADADDLHGDIIGDTEEAAGHGDQQQRAAGNAGSTTGTDGRKDAEQEGRREVNGNAQGVDGSQGHDGNGNGCAGHIDGRTERNGDGIRIGIDAEFLGQGQVDRDIRGRAARKEGRDARRLDAFPYQRVRIAADLGIDDDRVDDESEEQHRP